MKEVIYKTFNKLSCECGCDDTSLPVIICLNASKVASGFRSIEAAITSCDSSCCNGNYLYEYTISYDENLLVDPTYNLVNADITGAFCEDCFTNWVKDYVAGQIA